MRGVASFNAPAFNTADDALQAAGHETLNPARVDEANGFDLMGYDGTEDLSGIGFNLRDVLGADLAWIAEHADGVAILPGWTDSLGAKAEVATAHALGLLVGTVDYWTNGFAEDVRVTPDVYVPAIGDRVRIVDGDHLDPGKHYIGIVAAIDGSRQFHHGVPAPRVHPIELTDDNGVKWYAVEVELIETAAEIAEYEEACRKHEEWVAHWDDAQDLIVPREATKDDALEWANARTYSRYDHEALVSKPPPGWGDDRTPEQIAESDRAIEALRVKLAAGEVRVTSATGGEKGRKLAELGGIDPAALLTLAEVSGMGSRKYSAFNYLKGYDWSLSFNAMQRHALAFWAGQDNDDESSLPHIAHAAWHCLALLAFLQRDIGTDDRFRQDGV